MQSPYFHIESKLDKIIEPLKLSDLSVLPELLQKSIDRAANSKMRDKLSKVYKSFSGRCDREEVLREVKTFIDSVTKYTITVPTTGPYTKDCVIISDGYPPVRTHMHVRGINSVVNVHINAKSFKTYFEREWYHLPTMVEDITSQLKDTIKEMGFKHISPPEFAYLMILLSDTVFLALSF